MLCRLLYNIIIGAILGSIAALSLVGAVEFISRLIDGDWESTLLPLGIAISLATCFSLLLPDSEENKNEKL